MNIRVTGTLPNPFGEPVPNALIRFTALTSEGGVVVKGTEATYRTNAEGTYSMDLSVGRYLLEVLYTDEYSESGEVLVDESTPSPLTLSELVQHTAPYHPPVIVDTAPNWQQLFQSAVDNDEWGKQAEDQVRFEDKMVNEEKVLHKDGDAYLSKETYTTSSGSSSTTSQSLAYQDASEQDAATHTTEVSVDGAKGYDSLEAYSSSDGTNDLRNTRSLETASGAAESGISIQGKQSTSGVTLSQGGVSSESTEKVIDDGSTASVTLGKTASIDLLDEGVTHTASIDDTQQIGYGYTGDTPTASLNREVTVGTVSAKQELVVESGRATQTTSVNQYDITDAQGNSVMEVDTDAKRVTINARLEVANPDDFRGDDGWSYDVDLQWGHSGTSTADEDWFEVYSPEYPWQRSRKYKFIEGRLEETKVFIEPWGTPIRLNAIDGAEGDSYWIKYQYSTSANGPWVEAGSYDPDTHTWRRYIYVINGSNISDANSELYGPFDGWFKEQILGINGDQGEIVTTQYRYSRNGGVPDEEGSDPWHSNLVSTDYYRSERLAYFRVTEDMPDEDIPATWPYGSPYKTSVWGSAVKIKPKEGVDYGDKFVSVVLYKRYTRPVGDSTSTPSEVIGTMVWDFTSHTISPQDAALDSLNSWSQEVPDGSGDIWVAAATAKGRGETDVIDNNQWVYRELVVQGKDGFEGTYTSYVYTVTDSPVTPQKPDDATGTFTGALETMPTSGDGTLWWDTPSLAITNMPSGITGDYFVYESVCRYRQIEGDDSWEFLPYQDGTKWSAPISNSLGGMFLEHQYAVTSDTFPTDDLPNDQTNNTYWRRTRTVSVTGSGTLYSEWSGAEAYHPAPTLGVDFFDGANGKFTSYIYTTGSKDTPPNRPAGGGFYGSYEDFPDDWSDNPEYTSTGLTWLSKAVYEEKVVYDGVGGSTRTWVRNTDNHISGWTAPTQYLGKDGYDGMDGPYTSYVYKKTPTNVAPNPPVKGTGKFTGLPEDEDWPQGGWSDEPPERVAGEFIWVSFMKYVMVSDEEFTNTVEYVQTKEGNWSAPKLYTGADGLSAVPLALSLVGDADLFDPPAPVGTEPNGNMTYHPLTHTLTGIPTGWVWGLQDNTAEGGKLFVSENIALFPAGQESVTIKAEDWSDPNVVMANGITGNNGYNQATVNIYKRVEGTSVPTAPTSNIRYEFANKDLTGDLQEWEETVPNPKFDSNGKLIHSTVYAAVGVFVSKDSTDTIGDEGWDVVVYMKDASTATEEYQYCPTNSSRDSDWHYGFYDGDYFRRSRTVTETASGATYGAWSVGTRIRQDGVDGIKSQTLIVYKSGPELPTDKPDNDMYFNWDTGEVGPASSLNEWSALPPPNTQNLYWCLALVSDIATANLTAIGPWDNPSLLVSNGAKGETGNHGQGSFRKYEAKESDIPNNAGKDADVAAIAERPAQNGDMINYYNDDANQDNRFSRYWFRQSNVWEEAASVIDGNQVINGTLAAEAIKTQSITTDQLAVDNVYAGHIEAKTLTFVGEEDDKPYDDKGSAANAQDNAKDYTDSITSGISDDLVVAQDTADAAAIAASNAQSTADGSVDTYYQTSQPSSGKEGDIWVDTIAGNKQYMYASGAWRSIQDTGIAAAQTTANKAVNDADQAAIDAAAAQTTADGKVRTFYQTSSPTTDMSIGDIWVDTNDGNNQYMYTSSGWVDIQDQAIYSEAQKAKEDANAYTDGRNGVNIMCARYCGLKGNETQEKVKWSIGGTTDSSSVSIYPDEIDGGYGKGAIRFEKTGTSEGYIFLGANAGDYNITHAPHTKLLVSAYVRFSGTGSVPVQCYLRDSTGKYRGVTKTYNGDGTFVRMSWLINSLPSAEKASVLRFDNNGTSTSGFLYFDDIMVEHYIGDDLDPAPSIWAMPSQSKELTDVASQEYTEGRIYPDQDSIQIKSSSYVAGSTGWAIDKDGTAEFNDITIRNSTFSGVVLVGSGSSPRAGMIGTGSSTTAVRFFAGSSNAASAPFRVLDNGDLYASSGVFGGTVQADKIIGDLVSADTKSVAFNTISYTEATLCTFKVKNNTGKEAIMRLAGIMYQLTYTYNGPSTGTGRVRVRVLKDNSEVYNKSISISFDHENNGNTSSDRIYGSLGDYADTLSANDTSSHTYIVKVRKEASPGGSTGYALADSITAQLFPKGSAFS